MAREGLWMDAGQARGYASQINGGIASMHSLIEQIGSLIDGIYWEGEDKKAFVSDWHGDFKPGAHQATQALQDTADELHRRAQAQEDLSQNGH